MNLHIKHPIRGTPAFSERGLSLIELMISITIGLLILVSLTSMFVNQTRARTELDKANRMIDNGRYALELLSSNLKMAGFYDRFAPEGIPAAIFDPCNTAAMVDAGLNLDVLRLHIQGYDATSVTSQITSPPCSLVNSAGSALSLKPGSDILALRRVHTTLIYDQTAAPTNGTIYLQVSSCQFDSTLYRMSTDPTSMTLGRKKALSSNNCSSAGGVTTIAAPYETLRPFIVEVYYVSPDNNAGDGIPTLKRLELTSGPGASSIFVPRPLVEGVEFMQVEYGIDDPALDTDGINGVGLDGVPDSYSSCSACTLQQWSNVVSMKLHLVVRNTETTPGYSDPNTYSLGLAGNFTPTGAEANYKRHAYTQQVRLINPSGRREQP